MNRRVSAQNTSRMVPETPTHASRRRLGGVQEARRATLERFLALERLSMVKSLMESWRRRADNKHASLLEDTTYLRRLLDIMLVDMFLALCHHRNRQWHQWW